MNCVSVYNLHCLIQVIFPTATQEVIPVTYLSIPVNLCVPISPCLLLPPSTCHLLCSRLLLLTLAVGMMLVFALYSLYLIKKKMFYIFVMKGQTGINCCRDLLPHDISELCWSRGGFRELVNGKPL